MNQQLFDLKRECEAEIAQLQLNLNQKASEEAVLRQALTDTAEIFGATNLDAESTSRAAVEQLYCGESRIAEHQKERSLAEMAAERAVLALQAELSATQTLVESIEKEIRLASNSQLVSGVVNSLVRQLMQLAQSSNPENSRSSFGRSALIPRGQHPTSPWSGSDPWGGATPGKELLLQLEERLAAEFKSQQSTVSQEIARKVLAVINSYKTNSVGEGIAANNEASFSRTFSEWPKGVAMI